MRESDFIKKNAKKWSEIEKVTRSPYRNPRELYGLFLELMDDLSYARTFFRNRSVRDYLNGLSQSFYFTIYGTRKSGKNRVVHFWKTELPLLLFEARKELGWALIIFLGSVLIGVFSAMQDHEFVRSILGNYYVDMTLENIAEGDPMAVYKDEDRAGMTIKITLNNLWVDLLTFFSGIFYAVGSVGVLIVNGIMVGCFQYFLIDKGVIADSLLTVWVHGTLEMSAAVIAGGAGIVLGKGVAQPGTLSRAKALQLSARRGFKILLGILPLTIAAGFIEGYITRLTHLPYGLRLVFILLCLAFVIGYFVWYPRYISRKESKKLRSNFRLQTDEVEPMNFLKDNTFADTFQGAFLMLRRFFTPWLTIVLVGGLVFVVGGVFLAEFKLRDQFFWESGSFPILTNLKRFLYSDGHWWFQLLPTLVLATGALLSGKFVEHYQQQQPEGYWRSVVRDGLYLLGGWFWLVIAFSLFVGALQVDGFLATLYFLLVMPFFWLSGLAVAYEKLPFWKGMGRAVSLLSRNYLLVVSIIAVFTAMSVLFSLLVDSYVMQLLSYFIALLFEPEFLALIQFSTVTHLLLIWAWMVFTLHLFTATVAIHYYAMRNGQEAVELYELVQKFGKQEKIRGMARE